MLIDEKYQGCGYGKAFLPLLIERLEKIYDCDQIYLSVFANNPVAIGLYRQRGFVFTGEKDFGGEDIMKRSAT